MEPTAEEEAGLDIMAKQDFAASELDPHGETMSYESMLAEKAKMEGRTPPMKDSGAREALVDYGPQAPLELQYPAKAGAIARGRMLGLSDTVMRKQIDDSWNALRVAGLDDAQISEMMQGKRPFPPEIDPAHPGAMGTQILDQFQEAFGTTGVEKANAHTLFDYVKEAAKTAGGVAESVASGMMFGVKTKDIERAVAGPLLWDKLPEKSLAETETSEFTREVASIIGSGLTQGILTRAPGLQFLSKSALSPVGKLGPKLPSRATAEAIKWGGASMAYNAINQLLDKGKIDVGDLALSTGEAALFAGVIGKLTGPGRAKLDELVTKKAETLKPTESQTAHLKTAGEEVEKAFGKSKDYQAAKMEVGETTGATAQPKLARALVAPGDAERSTLTSSFKAKHPEVPEAQIASMSNLELKKKINWSYDPRQNLDNKDALSVLANDRGLKPLVGENHYGVVSPGGGYRAFQSEDEMVKFLSMQPTKSLPPVHKSMEKVLSGTVDDEAKSAIVRQKAHVESGGREFTKDQPTGLGVRPTDQLVKPYEHLHENHADALRLAEAINTEPGHTAKILPVGSRFMVLAVKKGSGEANRAVDLLAQEFAFKGVDKPGMIKGMKPADYIWMRQATGRPLSADDTAWVLGRKKNVAFETAMKPNRLPGRKAANAQLESFFGELPSYLEGKGITGPAAKKLTTQLTTALGKSQADARTLEPKLLQAVEQFDAKWIAKGHSSIAKDLLAILQRKAER